MATEPCDPDIERLNALIDGELPPAEHAALAGRIAAGREVAEAHATLARLKACIVASAEQTPTGAFVLPAPKRRLLPAVGFAAAAAAVLIAAIGWYPQRPVEEPPAFSIAPLVTLASLPAAPVIPDLAPAGLKLVGAEIERAGQTAVLVAAYRGPRGCRLELRVRPAAVDLPPTAGTSRRAWTAGDLAYELVAFGMPEGRFLAVALAAESATQAGQLPADADNRLRQAGLQAPPCVG
ncbi:MAG: hypothetical protein Q8M26_13655 [Pseudolabrys sp.]|nr:hypothetical protein [Pseudolabrys sp.]